MLNYGDQAVRIPAMLDRVDKPVPPATNARADGHPPSGALGMLLEYAWWTALFLAGVVVLHVLKLEAIAGHATPFYAFLRPLHESWTEVLALGPFIALPAILMRRILCGRWALGRLWGTLVVLSLVAPCVFVAEVYFARTGGDDHSLLRAAIIAVTIVARDSIPVLVAVAAIFLGLLAFGYVRTSDRSPSAPFLCLFLLGAMVCLFFFSGAVADLRAGPEGLTDGITKAYHRVTQEYIADIGQGGSIRGFMAQFVEIHPTLSHHQRVHPPGPTILLWLLSFLVGLEPLALSLATMAGATLMFIPCYLWAKELGGPRMGLVACAILAFSPGIVAFTATSADILFMPFTLTTLFLFERAVRRESRIAALGAGLFYALAAFCSFNILCIGFYFGLVGLWELREPEGRYPIIRTAALMLASFVGTYVVLYLWSGFNMVECFLTCWEEQRYDLNNQTDRWPGIWWRLFHPLSVMYYVGIPVTVLCVQRLYRPDAIQHPTFIMMALAFLFLNMVIPARGEMERTGLYMYPLLIGPAAHMLTTRWQQSRSEAPLAVAVGFLAFQCWLTEYLFWTYW